MGQSFQPKKENPLARKEENPVVRILARMLRREQLILLFDDDEFADDFGTEEGVERAFERRAQACLEAAKKSFVLSLVSLKLSLSSRKRELFEAARTRECLMHQITFPFRTSNA